MSFLFDKVDAIFGGIPDVVIFFVGTMFCYPMAKFVFPYIKNPNVSALIHIILGMTLALTLFNRDIIIVLVSIILGYGALYIPQAFYGSIVAFIILYGGHIIMAFRPCDWRLDFTGLTMILFQKIMSLCYNLEDGRKLAAGEKFRRKRWEDVAIMKIPSFLHFFAYAITPFGSFSNPFIEYKLFDYMLNRGKLDNSKVTPEDHKFALFRYIGSILWTGAVLFFMNHITYDTYFSSWYLACPYFIRMILTSCFSLCLCSRYFPGWWLVEAGYYEMGLGSAGIVKDDEISNLSLWIVCQSQTCDEWMRTWNHTTHLFWKNYLFTRMLNTKNAAGKQVFNSVHANFAVFICSMTWHGLRPVYYLLLPEAFYIMNTDKFWNSVLPQYQDQPWYISAIHNFWVVLTMSYCTSTWYFPWAEQFFAIRKTSLFLPAIINTFILISLKVYQMKKRKEPKPAEGGKAEETRPIRKCKYD